MNVADVARGSYLLVVMDEKGNRQTKSNHCTIGSYLDVLVVEETPTTA